MPILREWRGVIRKTERDAYVAYIRGTGISDYRNTPGNLGALMAVNDLDAERTEVVTLSLWSSWDAIRAFAGESPELARYYPEDDVSCSSARGRSSTTRHLGSCRPRRPLDQRRC